MFKPSQHPAGGSFASFEKQGRCEQSSFCWVRGMCGGCTMSRSPFSAISRSEFALLGAGFLEWPLCWSRT